MAKASTVVSIDFSNVKEVGNFNPKNIEEGDYRAKITKCELGKNKSGDPMFTFTIKIEGSNGVYPFYCPITEASAWKLRNLLIAGGLSAPKKMVKVDGSKLVGKSVAVSVEDDEYDGKIKSVIQSVFPVDELDGEDLDEDADDEDIEDEEEEEEEEEEPAPKRTRKSRAKKQPEPEEDDEEDEDDDDEEEEPPAKKSRARKTSSRSKKKAADDDDDDDEIDLDDI